MTKRTSRVKRGKTTKKMKRTNKHRIKQTPKKNKISRALRSGVPVVFDPAEFLADVVIGIAYILSAVYVGLLATAFILSFVITCYTLYALSEITFIGGKKLKNLALRWLTWIQGYDYKKRMDNISEILFPKINRYNKKVRSTIKGEIIIFHDEFKKKEEYIFNEKVFKLRLGLKILKEKYGQDEIDDKIKDDNILLTKIGEKEKIAFQWLIEEKKLRKLDKGEYLKKIMSGWCPETKQEQEVFELFKKHDHISLVIDMTFGDVKTIIDGYKKTARTKSGNLKKKKTIKKKKKKKVRSMSEVGGNIVKEDIESLGLEKSVEDKIKKEGDNELKVADKQESQSNKLGQSIIATNKSLINSIKSIRNKDESDNKRLARAGGILSFLLGLYGLIGGGRAETRVDPTKDSSIIEDSGILFSSLEQQMQAMLSMVFGGGDTHAEKEKKNINFAHSVKQYLSGIFNDPEFGVFELIKTIRRAIFTTFFDHENGIFPNLMDHIMDHPYISATVAGISLVGGTFTAVQTIIDKRKSILNSSDFLEKKEKIYVLKRKLEAEIYSTPDENQIDKKYMIDIIDNNLVELNEFTEQRDDEFINDFIKHIESSFRLKILTSLKICDPELTDGQLEIKTENIFDILKTKVNTYGELDDIYKEYIFKFNIGNMPSVKLKRKEIEKEREKIKSGKSSHKKRKKSKKKKSVKRKSKKRP